MKTLLTILSIVPALFAADAVITIDPDSPTVKSRFHIGVTHTHYFWEYGHANAVASARMLLSGNCAFQNQHIMGWGVGNPEPEPDVYNWNNLDGRVALMSTLTAPTDELMLTLCSAPGWMKETGDWEMEKRVTDKHVADFVELCAETAARYTDVAWFQVWNELKGYWSTSLNNWDYVRYTDMYNQVYNAIKDVRPDAKVGGPYIVIQGDGGVELGKSGRDTFVPIGSRDWAVLNYWLKNKTGADFLCFDYGLVDYHDPNTYSQAEKMQMTKHFGEVVRQIRAKTDLPIVISEFYGGADKNDLEFTAANHASCYRGAIINGAALALVWNPEQGEIDNFLFTDTEKSGGGQPTPHYDVFLAIRTHFSNGTQIVSAESSSEHVEVLASEQKTMLINKRDRAVTVSVNGAPVDLQRYQVLMMDTPAGTGLESRAVLDETSYVLGPKLFITPPRHGQIDFKLYNIRGRLVGSFTRRVLAGRQMVIDWQRIMKLQTSGVYFMSFQGAGLNDTKKLCYTRKEDF